MRGENEEDAPRNDTGPITQEVSFFMEEKLAHSARGDGKRNKEVFHYVIVRKITNSKWPNQSITLLTFPGIGQESSLEAVLEN